MQMGNKNGMGNQEKIYTTLMSMEYWKYKQTIRHRGKQNKQRSQISFIEPLQRSTWELKRPYDDWKHMPGTVEGWVGEGWGIELV